MAEDPTYKSEQSPIEELRCRAAACGHLKTILDAQAGIPIDEERLELLVEEVSANAFLTMTCECGPDCPSQLCQSPGQSRPLRGDPGVAFLAGSLLLAGCSALNAGALLAGFAEKVKAAHLPSRLVVV